MIAIFDVTQTLRFVGSMLGAKTVKNWAKSKVAIKSYVHLKSESYLGEDRLKNTPSIKSQYRSIKPYSLCIGLGYVTPDLMDLIYSVEGKGNFFTH